MKLPEVQLVEYGLFVRTCNQSLLNIYNIDSNLQLINKYNRINTVVYACKELLHWND